MSLRGSGSDSEKEHEADSFAEDQLLPDFTPENLEDLSGVDIKNYALKYNVHPAIVAGRVQYMLNNYKLFSNFISSDKIKRPWE
jgi:HTH-type transcriptional regulator/antitoxin HigA